MLRPLVLLSGMFLVRPATSQEVQLPARATLDHPAIVSMEMIYPLDDRPTPQCHASTICETKQGLVAAWFGGTREGADDVGIWVARKAGDLNRAGSWSPAVQVATGAEGEDRDYPCWNPVLFQLRDGPLLLFYKVGPSPRLWWGVVRTSQDGGVRWSDPRRLGTSDKLLAKNRNLLGPVKNKPLELADGTLLCPSSTENEGWRIHFELTRDAGRTWEVIGPIHDASRFDAIQPSILTYPDGRLQILCRTQQGVVGQSWSSDRGKTWGPVTATTLPNPNSGTDALTLADGRQLLVYNHAVRESGRNGRQILNVALSTDGVQWRTLLTLEQEPGRAEFSYPAVIQTKDGKIHISYTYQRASIKHVTIDPQQLTLR